MDVLFDARLLHRAVSGLERVQLNLLRELARRPGVVRLRALLQPDTRLAEPLPDRVEPVEVATTEEILALLLAEDPAERPGIYHLTYFPDRNPRDLLLLPAARVAVLSVTDAILNRHPEYFPSAAAHRWYDDFVRALVGSADRVVSYSASAGREARDLGAAADRVDIVPLAVDPALGEPLPPVEVAARLRKLSITGDYFLSVGKDYPHKDHRTMIRALARTKGGARLICAGSRVWHGRDERGETLDDVITRSRMDGRVRWVAGLSDADVKALMQGSKGLVYASREEGFGLPPLEAMMLGVPVVAAAAMSVPEVCGDGAFLFEPGREDQLAVLLEKLLAGGAAVDAQIEKGRCRAREFTWERSGDALLACYRRASSRVAEADGTAVRLSSPARDLLGLAVRSPFGDSSDLVAWQRRCRAVEDELAAITAHRDELERMVRELKALMPRWSLRRRFQKIRRALRSRRK